MKKKFFFFPDVKNTYDTKNCKRNQLEKDYRQCWTTENEDVFKSWMSASEFIMIKKETANE